MRNYYIGIDNGVSGSIGIVDQNHTGRSYPTPVKRVLNYTKEEAWLNRMDREKLKGILAEFPKEESIILLERPMVNPKRFKASVSAIRALESTLTVLEDLELPYIYIDSKEWQKEMLPRGISGDDLKVASLQVARRLFPNLDIKKDGDGILIAEWGRRKNL